MQRVSVYCLTMSPPVVDTHRYTFVCMTLQSSPQVVDVHDLTFTLYNVTSRPYQVSVICHNPPPFFRAWQAASAMPRASSSAATPRQKFSNGLARVPQYSECTRALTFENLRRPRHAPLVGPLRPLRYDHCATAISPHSAPASFSPSSQPTFSLSPRPKPRPRYSRQEGTSESVTWGRWPGAEGEQKLFLCTLGTGP